MKVTSILYIMKIYPAANTHLKFMCPTAVLRVMCSEDKANKLGVLKGDIWLSGSIWT